LLNPRDHIASANRENRFLFLCRECGYFSHADHNAALNIACAAAVNQPEVAENAPAA
jgi:transposase